MIPSESRDGNLSLLTPSRQITLLSGISPVDTAYLLVTFLISNQLSQYHGVQVSSILLSNSPKHRNDAANLNVSRKRSLSMCPLKEKSKISQRNQMLGLI